MSKSILVIETPSSCSECTVMHCDALPMFARNKYNKQRHQQCPLQDATELLEALEDIKIITKDKNKIKSYYKLYNALGGE